MAHQSERITILGSTEFKTYLASEAANEGISMSELVRRRCLKQKRKSSTNEIALAILAGQIRTATAKANLSLEKGLNDAKRILAEIRRNK
jgi:hypothetical protein